MNVSYLRPGPALPRRAPGRIGVLLVNLGTPEGTGYRPMRRYLSQFLSDPRVIELPRALWQILLQGPILATRPQRSGKAYARIWNQALNESPLKTVTREQAEALSMRLRLEYGDQLVVDWAMRYGEPAIGATIERMAAAGCNRILLFPLYPQYSATTTATACDEAFRQLMKMRSQPALRTVPAYHDEPAYIEALARSIERHVGGLGWWPDMLLISFHGIPKHYADKGDPYREACAETAAKLTQRLGWEEGRVQMSYQSRFGRAEWLRPYTDETVRSLAQRGIKRLCMVAPGFAADCVETLEELAVENCDYFMEAGGESFSYVPALNSEPEHIEMLAQLIEGELGGWIQRSVPEPFKIASR
jgi:ferrochelatase